MKTTQHTPALEAAKAINARFEETHGVQLSRYEIASLIVQHYGNAHNELLEACKTAQQLSAVGLSDERISAQGLLSLLQTIQEQTNAAIAKAAQVKE